MLVLNDGIPFLVRTLMGTTKRTSYMTSGSTRAHSYLLITFVGPWLTAFSGLGIYLETGLSCISTVMANRLNLLRKQQLGRYRAVQIYTELRYLPLLPRASCCTSVTKWSRQYGFLRPYMCRTRYSYLRHANKNPPPLSLSTHTHTHTLTHARRVGRNNETQTEGLNLFRLHRKNFSW